MSINNCNCNKKNNIDSFVPIRTLCCYGPTGPQGIIGPTGQTGPTGPAGSPSPTSTLLSSLVDNDGRQIVAAGNLIDFGEVINSTGSAITFTAPSTITLEEPGTYYILFAALIYNTGASGSLGASIQINGVTIPNASQYISGTTEENQMILQHNITISEPTTVTVINQSTVPNGYHDSSLSIIKIS